MRRRRRTDGGRGTRDATSSGSLMYYLDIYTQSRLLADTPDCALVHNVVGTARISMSAMPLDLQLVNTLLPNSCFVKKKFAAITVRLNDPTCTMLLFGSGKCVLTGCRDFISCIRAVYNVVELLRANIHGVYFGVENIQMQNIVGHADLMLHGSHVDLARFYADNNIECTFQRSMFPGLVYRSSQSNVVLLVFRSGRVVLTGGRDIQCLNDAWLRVRPKLVKYVVRDAKAQGAESTLRADLVYGACAANTDECAGACTRRRVDSNVSSERTRARRGAGRG